MKEYPYWWDTVQPSVRPKAAAAAFGGFGLQSAPRRGGTHKFDVAIIGAGYTGLSAARSLAGSGASVIVLERERVGWGASSRNGGQVITGLKVDPVTLVARYGERRARELFDVSLGAIARLEALISNEAIDCEYERTGHLQAASKASHFEIGRASCRERV